MRSLFRQRGNIVVQVVPFVPPVAINLWVQKDLQNNPEQISGNFRFDMFFRANGLRAFSARDSANRMDQHDVSPAYSIASGTWTNRINIALFDPRWIWWKPDGTRFFSAAGGSLISQSDAGTPFDISTLTGAGNKSQGVQTLDAYMSADGFTLWGYESSTNTIRERVMSTAFDITTLNLTPVSSFLLTPDAPGLRSFTFTPDGTVLYGIVTVGNPGSFAQWTLSTAFQLSTIGSFILGPLVGTPSEVNIPRGLNYIAAGPETGNLLVFGDQGSTDRVKRFGPP